MKKIISLLLMAVSFAAFPQSIPNVWAPTSGTNTYTTNISNFGSSYSNKIAFVSFTNGNTSTGTININSIGAANLRLWDGDSWEPLVSGDIPANTKCIIVYQGSYFEVFKIQNGSGGGGTWGSITGTLSDQTDLQTALNAKGNTASPLSQFASTTSAQMASTISNETGTNLMVFSDDPTLANPKVNTSIVTYTSDQVASLSDLGKYVELSSASPLNFTIPPNSSVNFSVGATLVVTQTGAGAVTVVAGSGVTITNPAGGDLLSPGQGLPFIIWQRTTDNWVIWNGSGNNVDLSNDVTGVLQEANGGTGVTDLSGTYTPTLSNTTNVAASTAYVTGWFRVGDMVTVFGKVDIDVTTAASTATELGISLPIASNLAAEQDLGGVASSNAAASLVGRIQGDSTNDRASVVFLATSATNDSYAFQFSYQVK